jgi:hypothetical protein
VELDATKSPTAILSLPDARHLTKRTVGYNPPTGCASSVRESYDDE